MLHKVRDNQKGIALIMVLWAMVLMAAVASEFAFCMRTEINSTRNFKEELESSFLAESGIELAMAEILEEADFHMLGSKGSLVFAKTRSTEIEETGETVESLDEKEPKRIDIPLGAGTVSYRIIDENRKININKAPKNVLLKLLEMGGVIDEELRDSIADSILDWVDVDDLHRLNGAEEDYYEKMPEPYSCKNSLIDNPEELILIKDITPEILFGTKLVKELGLKNEGEEEEYVEESEEEGEENNMQGIYHLITTQNTARLNPSTANEQVLNVFYSPDVVKSMLEKRAEGEDTKAKSSHFTIYSLGEIEGSGIKRLKVATVKLTYIDKEPQIFITYWNDNADPQKYDDLFN